MRGVAAASIVVALAGGCRSATTGADSGFPTPVTDQSPLPNGVFARVSGVVERGVLPRGTATMRFQSGARVIDVPIDANRFLVDLPAGTWSQRSTDGRICDQPFTVGPTAAHGYFTDEQYIGDLAGCVPITSRGN